MSMSSVIVLEDGRVVGTGPALTEMTSPPADRMTGRYQARAARLEAKGKAKSKAKAAPEKAPPEETGVDAATAARANAFLEREALLDQAVHDGRINEGMRGYYAQAFDKNPTDTRAFLSKLGAAQGSSPAVGASEEYDESLLSDGERSRIAAARGGRQFTRVVDGC